MNVALWVVHLLTELAYGQHGYSLLFGLERARKRLAWTRDVETGILRLIGVAEILGAVGVLLPAATGVLTWLSVLAAGGAGDHHGARDRLPFVPARVAEHPAQLRAGTLPSRRRVRPSGDRPLLVTRQPEPSALILNDSSCYHFRVLDPAFSRLSPRPSTWQQSAAVTTVEQGCAVEAP